MKSCMDIKRQILRTSGRGILLTNKNNKSTIITFIKCKGKMKTSELSIGHVSLASIHIHLYFHGGGAGVLEIAAAACLEILFDWKH